MAREAKIIRLSEVFTDSLNRAKKMDSSYKMKFIPNVKILDQQPIQPGKAVFNSVEFYYGVCLGLIILAGIWLLAALIFKRLKKNRLNMKNNAHMDKGYHLELRVINLERELKIVKDNLKVVEGERDYYKKKYDEAVKDLDEGHIVDEESIIDQSQLIEVLDRTNSDTLQYFPSPLADGTFRKIDGKSIFLEAASIYCFRLKSDTEAEFDFCEDPSSVSMALNNRNDLILSVAEEIEGDATGAKKILTYNGESGRATLGDNKWIVVKKLKIKYI